MKNFFLFVNSFEDVLKEVPSDRITKCIVLFVILLDPFSTIFHPVFVWYVLSERKDQREKCEWKQKSLKTKNLFILSHSQREEVTLTQLSRISCRQEQQSVHHHNHHL